MKPTVSNNHNVVNVQSYEPANTNKPIYYVARFGVVKLIYTVQMYNYLNCRTIDR